MLRNRSYTASTKIRCNRENPWYHAWTSICQFAFGECFQHREFLKRWYRESPKNVALQQAETIQFATKLASWELGKQSMGATSQGLHGRAGTHYFHDSPPELVSTWQLCTFPILSSCNCLRFGPATGALAACRPLGGLATDLSAEYQHNGSRHHSLHAVGWATSTHEWLVRLWGEDLEEKVWREEQFNNLSQINILTHDFVVESKPMFPNKTTFERIMFPMIMPPQSNKDIPQTKFKSHHSSDVATWGHCNLSKIVCERVCVCILYIYVYIYMVSLPMVYLQHPIHVNMVIYIIYVYRCNFYVYHHKIRPRRRCRGVVV